jgi:hypothetical protein
VPATHDLAALWSKAETLFRAYYGAEVPKDRDGGLVLEGIAHVNLRHLVGVMQRLGDLPECLSIDLGERVDWAREMNVHEGPRALVWDSPLSLGVGR